MIFDASALSTRCSQLSAVLTAKAPKGHLAYVAIHMTISGSLVQFRAAASVWLPSGPPNNHLFEVYETGENPHSLLDKVEHSISLFEAWTPSAIAATLGIPG